MIPNFVGVRSSGEVTVVVYDSRIDAMNFPGGMVYRYTERKVDSTVRYAKVFAPKRTGRMAGQIRRDIRSLRSGVVGRVRSPARYSAYVHEGTGPFIYPTSGKYLSIPQSRYSVSRRTLKPFVRGQRANPFLQRAMETAVGAGFPTYVRPIGPSNPFV